MKKTGTKNKILDRGRLVENVPFFRYLTEEDFGELKHIFIEKSFSKGEVILSEEDTANYMYVILSGRVKVVHYGNDGKEHILAMHTRGDFFGEMALIDGRTSPATVSAMEETKAVIVSKNDFDEHLLNNKTVSRQLLLLLCSRLRESWVMLKVLGQLNAEHRVRALLRHVADEHGVKDSRGTIIAIKMTHQDIADYSAVSRETVTRLLNRLVGEGEIEILDDKSILLKPSFV